MLCPKGHPFWTRGFATSSQEETWGPYLSQSCAQRMVAYIRASVAGCGGKTVNPNFGGTPAARGGEQARSSVRVGLVGSESRGRGRWLESDGLGDMKLELWLELRFHFGWTFLGTEMRLRPRGWTLDPHIQSVMFWESLSSQAMWTTMRRSRRATL